MDSIQRGDNFDYLASLIKNKQLEQHERINTIEKLSAFLAEHQGPSLEQAMTLTMQDLLKRNCNLEAVPLTEDELQKKQLEDAILLFNLGEYPPQEEEEPLQEEPQDVEVVEEKKILWKKNPMVKDNEDYSWYRTVWFRVNFAQYFLSPQHSRDFVNAHLTCVQYLDTLDDPRDDLLELNRLIYTPLKNKNIDYGERKVIWTQIKETPLFIVQKAFPSLVWTVEDVINKVFVQEDFYFEMESYIDDDQWAPIKPEEAPFDSYRIYYACIYLVNQIKRLLKDDTSTLADEIKDALWFYYVGFLDFFIYVSSNDPKESSDFVLLTPVNSTFTQATKKMQYSDCLTPWEMYGSALDVRTKHAGFLPDLFHVLNSIPLGGEQCTPLSRVGKIYQKSLPFACQRRHITSLIVDSVRSDDAFWLLCSQLFWVMFADLYPSSLSPLERTKGSLTMRDLIRARELTLSKQAFIEMLEQSSLDRQTKDGGPLVVFTAFRMHIVYMASFNTAYAENARTCIDWDHFVAATCEAAAIIRESDLLPEDPLARARAQLIRAVKNNASRVARIHRRPLAVTLTERCNEILEKTIIRDYYVKRNSGENPLDVAFYEKILSLDCKCSIANFLLRIPPSERFTFKAYSTLTLREYGGLSPNTVERMYDLTCMYHANSGMPKDFTRILDQFDTRDFVISCYYFNMATELERISFVPLDAETVRRTDEAMLHTRYRLFPGQTLPPHAYNIQIALCCGRICTLMGQGKYGSKTVCFDVENQCFVCARSKSLHTKNRLGADISPEGEEDDDDDENDNEDDEEDEEDRIGDVLAAQNDHIENVENLLLRGIDLVSDAITENGRGTKRSAEMAARKAIRTERKRFNRIPCGQPVLTINLRGRALIWGNIKEKYKQYMFCPQCGAFHIYSILNYSGAPDGKYRCNECAIKSLDRWFDYKCCAYCKKDRTVTDETRLPVCTFADPKQGGGGEEWMYFCRNHYHIAKRYYNKCTSQQMLWNIIQRVEHKRTMDMAKKNLI